LEKDPDKRIQNWTDVIDGLEHLGPKRVPTTSSAQIAEHKRRTSKRKSALPPARPKKTHRVLFSSLFFLLLVCLVALTLGYIFGKLTQ
ncbi:MAG: hypothetical protein IKN52_15985, partial [Victivallales bacterium]|nr:hypothetical protein [Victivallales bacterium]